MADCPVLPALAWFMPVEGRFGFIAFALLINQFHERSMRNARRSQTRNRDDFGR